MKRTANDIDGVGGVKKSLLSYSPFNQTLHDHFNGKVSIKDIPKWDVSILWKNTIEKCPISSNLDCDICKKLMFDVIIRGTSSVNLKWFENKKECMAEKEVQDRYPDVFCDSFRTYYRPSEMKLRLIKRKDVLHYLVTNFWGHDSNSNTQKELIQIIEQEFTNKDEKKKILWLLGLISKSIMTFLQRKRLMKRIIQTTTVVVVVRNASQILLLAILIKFAQITSVILIINKDQIGQG